MYPRSVIRSSLAGGAFSFAGLPTFTQMQGEAQGTLAFTSDRGLVCWNGSSWATVSNSSTLVAPGGGTTDDLVINSAIASVAAVGGGLVQLTEGQFFLKSYISVLSGVTLAGFGMGKTVLKVNASATSTDPDNSGWITMDGVANSGVQDLTLDLSGISASSPGDGIVFAPPLSNSLPNSISYTSLTGTFVTGEYVTGSTSNARAAVLKVYGSTSLSLVDIAGTFQSGETLTGLLSGATATSSSAVTNITSDRCFARRCEILGKPFSVQYLFWARQSTNIDIESCIADGNSVTETSGQFAFNTTPVDQNGFEIFGGYNVRISGCRARSCAGVGVLASLASGPCIDNANIIIEKNFADQCSTGIEASSFYSSTYGVSLLRDVLIKNNIVMNSWRAGITVNHNSGEAYANVIQENVIIEGNLVDLTGSYKAATYGQLSFAIPGNTTIGTAIYNGCKIIGNSFIGGGGGNGSTTLLYGAFLLEYANGWEVKDNTIDSVANTNTTTNVYLTHCSDTLFTGNTISNPGKQAFNALTCLRLRFTNNKIVGVPSISTSYGMYLQGTCSDSQIVGNTFNQQGGNSYYVLGGDNTGTLMEIANNTLIGSTLGITPGNAPYVSEGGQISTVGTLTGTATTGTYTNTTLTGGTGAGAQGTVTVTAGSVTGVTITTAGSGYLIGDSLAFTVTGGSGTCAVATLVSVTTQTHAFGTYSPADAAGSFTITNAKIRKQSQIKFWQTGGTANAVTVQPKTGSMVVTGTFAGSTSFSWEIVN